LVILNQSDGAYRAGRFLRANQLHRYREVENGDWKLLIFDQNSGEPRMPKGSIGFRWQSREGQWNLELKDGVDDSKLEPQLSFLEGREAELSVIFEDFGNSKEFQRNVPVKYLETAQGRVAVTTVFDLLMAHFGVARGLKGEYPSGYDDAESPHTPAWQEKFTGVGRNTVVQFAREFATTAEKTRGKCTVIVGSGVNHWYHSNLIYRSGITSLILCGCVGVNGGGLNHYTGQEKLVPAASWTTLAMALDWIRPPRLQNGPSFHYVHSDQWHYEKEIADRRPRSGFFARQHTLELQVDAVRMGWLPFYPQFNRNPIQIVRNAEEAGAHTAQEIADWTVNQLRTGKVRFLDDCSASRTTEPGR